MRLSARIFCILLCLIQIGFLTWEFLDWRSSRDTANTLLWTIVTFFCAGLTWFETAQWTSG
jgi:hypothetical protein